MKELDESAMSVLKALVRHYPRRMDDLARDLGVSSRIVSRWLHGHTKSMQPELWARVNALANSLPSATKPITTMPANGNAYTGRRLIVLPVLSAAWCAQHGPAVFVNPVPAGAIDRDGEEEVAAIEDGSRLFAFRAKGDSMAPKINEGDVVVAAEHAPLNEMLGGEVVAIFGDPHGAGEDILIKQLVAADATTIRLHSYFPVNAPDMQLATSDLRCLWPVVQVISPRRVRRRK